MPKTSLGERRIYAAFYLPPIHIPSVIGAMKMLVLASSTFPFSLPHWLLMGLLLLLGKAVSVAIKEMSKNSRSGTPPDSGSSNSEVAKASPAAANPDSSNLIVSGYVCAFASIFILPPFLGLLGIVCGAIAIKRHSPNPGLTLIVVSFICALIGVLWGVTNAASLP